MKTLSSGFTMSPWKRSEYQYSFAYLTSLRIGSVFGSLSISHFEGSYMIAARNIMTNRNICTCIFMLC